MTLESAISELSRTAVGKRAAANWRWLMRQQLSVVREALSEERFAAWDGWLAARSWSMERERRELVRRATTIGTGVLDRLEPERITHEVQRLIEDIEHYRQKVRDLVYDSVNLEIGGSE